MCGGWNVAAGPSGRGLTHSARREGMRLDTNRQLEAFFVRIERRAYRIAQIATGDADEALDLVQDTMMKLVQKYAHKPEDEWQPLFYRILNSRIMDWHRRNKVRGRWRVWLGGDDENGGADPLQTLPDTNAEPQRQWELDAAGEALQVALRKLSSRQQQAFLLRVWEGLGVADTAFAMGCSEGSVKTHYSRAVHALRAELEDHWS